ncbi:2933_t:CDS:1, partial [Paraglomus occultum]
PNMIKNLLYNLCYLPNDGGHSVYAQRNIDVIPMDIDAQSPFPKQIASSTNTCVMHLQSVIITAPLPQSTFSSPQITKIDPFDLSDLTRALPNYYPPAHSVEEQLAQQLTKLLL